MFKVVNIDGLEGSLSEVELVNLAKSAFLENEESDTDLVEPSNLKESLFYISEYCGNMEVTNELLEKEKKDWVGDAEILSEHTLGEFGTVVVLTKSKRDVERYNLLRFFVGGGVYQTSVEKSRAPLGECIERMMYLQKEYG